MPDTDAILSEIREQLSAKDISTLDLLLSSFDPDKLDAEFYRKAAKDADWIKGKKFVIWCFFARAFTESTSGWPNVPVLKK